MHANMLTRSLMSYRYQRVMLLHDDVLYWGTQWEKQQEFRMCVISFKLLFVNGSVDQVVFLQDQATDVTLVSWWLCDLGGKAGSWRYKRGEANLGVQSNAAEQMRLTPNSHQSLKGQNPSQSPKDGRLHRTFNYVLRRSPNSGAQSFSFAQKEQNLQAHWTQT